MESGEITRILVAARHGEPHAMDQLLPLVYDELRLQARQQLRRRRPGQTLDTTALVHEAYLKLVDPSQTDYRDRSHFFAVAAVAVLPRRSERVSTQRWPQRPSRARPPYRSSLGPRTTPLLQAQRQRGHTSSVLAGSELP